ncbi:MAG: hypothetical protein ACKOHM_05440 [Spartobacteria bacterium]
MISNFAPRNLPTNAQHFQHPREVFVLLTQQQVSLLLEDLDYIIPRTRCNTMPLTKSHIVRDTWSDGDILLDLVEGMADSDARYLSVPLEKLRGLIAQRQRGVQGSSPENEADCMPSLFG